MGEHNSFGLTGCSRRINDGCQIGTFKLTQPGIDKRQRFGIISGSDKIIKIDGRFIFGFQHYIPVKDNDLFQDRTFLLYFICVIVLELLTYKYHL